ncbi:DNA polymerase delta subunit 3-like [Venturia nashicola]|nr:DNA polymerase delta subunit 3-like [Venturia nashicola]
MSGEYNEYLAVHVLNEQQLVSYRSLSRALKVHVNLAKQMLFEFHQKQNAKKPGSVHATYLITGTRIPPKSQHPTKTESQDDGDVVMQSSPRIPNSSAPQAPDDETGPTPIRSILLVKEEHLQQAKATFEHITGIHVYSLAAGGLSDLNSLTECNRKIAVEYASEDPLVAWKQYGTIQNPNVKRRTQKRPPPAPAPVAKETIAKAKPTPALEKQASKASNESVPNSAKATPVPEKNADASNKQTATKPTTNRRQASDIFKSFAKGANKAKKPASTESSAAPSPAPGTSVKEDESMGGMSDDDPDDPVDDEELAVDAVSGKLKKDREADLKAMMDVDDEPMEDADEGVSQGAIDTPKESEAEESQATQQEEPKETVTVENGRRRGRRRVMKKKTVKDEEGYLVTREEAAWESFSEDEPAPKKAKPTPAPAAKGAKKSAAKPGQGNIMSFFGKK